MSNKRSIEAIHKMLDLLDPKSGHNRGQAQEEARARKIMEYIRQIDYYPPAKVERVCRKYVEGKIDGQWLGGWPTPAQFGHALQNDTAQTGDYDGWTHPAKIAASPPPIEDRSYRDPIIESNHDRWRRLGRATIKKWGRHGRIDGDEETK